MTSSIYLSFAVERISAAGGLAGIAAGSAGPVMYLVFGIGGLSGLLTADIEQRIGLTTLVRATFAASFVSVGLLGWYPTAWVSVLVSAGLQGACVMILSAIYAFWSARLYPNRPTTGMTVVVVWFAAGNVAGPVIAGYAAENLGLGMVLSAAAGISIATAALFPGQARRRRL